MPNSYNSVHTGEWQDDLFNLIYPIGSIYLSVNETSPAILFGGTWEQIKDKFLLSAGDTYSNGDTGGAANVTSGGTAITVAQMPSHTHDYKLYGNAVGTTGQDAHQGKFAAAKWNSDATEVNNTTTNRSWTCGNGKSAEVHLYATGGGQAHTHTVSTMPPYLTVYMWKRTA